MAQELRQQEQAGELSDEQLDQVAGGDSMLDPFAAVGRSVATAYCELALRGTNNYTVIQYDPWA